MNAIVPNAAVCTLVAVEPNFDTLTCTDLGSAFGMAQVSEDGDMHDVIIGREQALVLLKALQGFLG